MDDALKAARELIARRSRDPKAKMFGLDADLKVIGAAFDEFERRTDALAAFALRVYATAPLPLPRAQLQRLGEMGKESGAVWRWMEHGAKESGGVEK